MKILFSTTNHPLLMYPGKKPKVLTFKINKQIKIQFKESENEINIFIATKIIL